MQSWGSPRQTPSFLGLGCKKGDGGFVTCTGHIRASQAPGTARIGEHAWIRLGLRRIACLVHGCFACWERCRVKHANSTCGTTGSPDTAQRPPVCGVETTWRIQSVERVFGSQSLNTPPHADTHRESPAILGARPCIIELVTIPLV